MSPQVHQTAIVHPKAELNDDVSVGPYTVIGEHVRIGRGTRIDSHVVIEGWTEVGYGDSKGLRNALRQAIALRCC